MPAPDCRRIPSAGRQRCEWGNFSYMRSVVPKMTCRTLKETERDQLNVVRYVRKNPNHVKRLGL